VSEAD